LNFTKGRIFFKNGISVLLAAQNEEKLIRVSAESFLEFADEIIIVTNRSTDGTVDICRELEREYPQKIRYFDKPELPDLTYNRAFAHSRARYRWIAKFDSDFVAYNDEDEERSIRHLREKILNTSAIYPVEFHLTLINIYRSIFECGTDRDRRERKADGKVGGHYVPGIYSRMPKIFLNTPLLKFVRKGRWEHIRFEKIYRKIKIDRPYIFHLTLNPDLELFRRSERTNWRELGNFDLYPDLDSYIENYVLPVKYKLPLQEAVKKYIAEDISPYLQKYREEDNYPYPARIKRLIASGFFK
jgi:glycosyltransferase involved in cell wall biosynthesis